MSIGSSDPTDPRFELVQLRERLRYAEERVRQLEDGLKQVYVDLGRKEDQLQRIREERDDLKVKWEVAKADIAHKQELLGLARQKARDKRSRRIGYNIFGNMLICLAGVLVAFGTSTLTTMPSSLTGWMLIVSAIALYLVGAVSIATKGSGE
jgi:hypothetical protein